MTNLTVMASCKQNRRITMEEKKKLRSNKGKTGCAKRTQSCENCGSAFLTAMGLEQHMIIHRTLKESDFKCGQCQETFSNVQTYGKHMLKHDVKMFTCKSCNMSFKYLQSYIRHMKDYAEPHAFPCTSCGKVFKRIAFLNKHYCVKKQEEYKISSVLNYHSENANGSNHQPDNDPTLAGRQTENNLPMQEEPTLEILDYRLSISEPQKKMGNFYLKEFQCMKCLWVFTSKLSLKRHLRTYADNHLSYPCCGQPLQRNCMMLSHECSIERIKENVPLETKDNAFPSFFETASLDSESDSSNCKESEEERPFKCDSCSASFFRLHSLKHHLQKYPDKHDFRCGKCKKHFQDSSILNKHLCILEGGKEFQCSCFKVFSSLKNFKRHVGNRRPYFCCACNKQNETFNNLINHIRTHTKEKPYACKFCTKSFSVKESLNLHLRSHDGIKLHKCSKCPYSASTKWNLKLHEKRHNPNRKQERTHLCPECGSAFYMKHHLRRHISTHSPDKSHLCRFCGKLFSQSSYLAKHMENHTKESKCPKCHMELEKNASYKHHVETGHFELVCDPCEKVFYAKYNLERHIKCHNRPKLPPGRFECQLCRKPFACKRNLEKHYETHADTEKKIKFLCHYCNRSFSRRGNLNQHIQSHEKSLPKAFDITVQQDWTRQYNQGSCADPVYNLHHTNTSNI